jgi:hypothetical protein
VEENKDLRIMFITSEWNMNMMMNDIHDNCICKNTAKTLLYVRKKLIAALILFIGSVRDT